MSLISSINMFSGVDLNAIYSQLDRADQGQFLGAMRLLDPRSAEQLHAASGGPVADGMRVSMPQQPAVASQPATAGPRAAYSQNRSAHYSAIPAEAQVHLSTGKTVSGKSLGKFLDMRMDKDPEAANEFMANNGIVRNGPGSYSIANARVNGSAESALSGAVSSSSGGISFGGKLLKWGAVAAGGLTFGLPGAIMAFAGSSLGSSIGGGLGSVLGMGGGVAALGALTGGGSGLTSAAGTLGALPGMMHMGSYGTMATAAQAMGQDGLAFKLRSQMRSIASDYQDTTMIDMINNSSMSIEDLVFYFLSYMTGKYEQKLREKMEETALQEKLERRQQRRKDEAQMKGGLIGGVLGMVPGVGTGVGNMVSTGMQMQAQKVNDIDTAINGTGKSSTLLANEIQVLMNKWKQLTEMMSNIIKTMHEMAMTPIRNIR